MTIFNFEFLEALKQSLDLLYSNVKGAHGEKAEEIDFDPQIPTLFNRHLLLINPPVNKVMFFFFLLLVYRILGSKTKNTVYSSFLSLTVEKTISYYYLLSLLVPIISYYSFFWGGPFNNRS